MLILLVDYGRLWYKLWSCNSSEAVCCVSVDLELHITKKPGGSWNLGLNIEAVRVAFVSSLQSHLFIALVALYGCWWPLHDSVDTHHASHLQPCQLHHSTLLAYVDPLAVLLHSSYQTKWEDSMAAFGIFIANCMTMFLFICSKSLQGCP